MERHTEHTGEKTEKKEVKALKFIFFTNYPPAFGEESFYAYWFAQDLGRAGHHVSVIKSSREAGSGSRIALEHDEQPLLEPQNVRLFTSRNPESREDREKVTGEPGLTDRLVNCALGVPEGNEIDLILCSNFYPSGTAGMLTSLILNKPFIISDRNRAFPEILDNPWLCALMSETLRRVEKIEVRERDMGYFRNLGMPRGRISNLYLEGMVNPDYFTADAMPLDFSPYTEIEVNDQPVFTFIDNPEPKKKLQRLIQAAASIRRKDFLLCFHFNRAPETLIQNCRNLIVSQGLAERTIFLPHLPPWKFTSLMKSSRAVIYPGSVDDYASPPRYIRLPYFMEVLLSRKCTILSRSLYGKSRFSFLQHGRELLLFDHTEPDELASLMDSLISNPASAESAGLHAQEAVVRENEHHEILTEKLVMFSEVCEHFIRHGGRKEMHQ